MATHPCPRCGVLVPVGVQYCSRCRPLAEASLQEYRERKAAYKAKQYNKTRNPRTRQFYQSKEWRTLSKAKLQAAGWRCEAQLEGCTRMAVEVHHLQPIQTDAGWATRLEWSGLEAVCTSCHNKRHPSKLKRQQGPDDVIDLSKLHKGHPRGVG